MPSIEVSLPDRIDSEIDRLVEQGEFLNREQAVEELLSMGMSAHGDPASADEDDEWIAQNDSERQDPALRDEFDEPGF